MQEIAVDFVHSLKTKRFNGHAKCTVWVSTKLTSLLLAVRTSTVAAESKKSKNDHFHPWFTIIVFNIKSCLFSVVKNKQTRPRFLVLEKFVTCLPPEKPRDIAFIQSVLKCVQRSRASWIRSIAGKPKWWSFATYKLKLGRRRSWLKDFLKKYDEELTAKKLTEKYLENSGENCSAECGHANVSSWRESKINWKEENCRHVWHTDLPNVHN